MGSGGWSLLGPLRFALSFFYGLHARMTPSPVVTPGRSGPKIISVGNIEVGGSGKTPCVLTIASALIAQGLKPAVVTRGYGGRATREGGALALPEQQAGVALLPDGYSLWTDGIGESAAGELGDEAVLYLRAGLPVAVDRDRMRGIKVVSEAMGPTHVILDDAFHRTEIPKDLDILLLDAERPFGNGRLLPYGTLREPASAVSRAGAIIFTRAQERSVPAEAARFIAGKPVFFARHEPVSLHGGNRERITTGDLAGSKIALFSGIARPGSFEKTAIDFGLEPDVSFRYDDHHEYSLEELQDIIDECGTGTVFVTTAKDLVKVASIFPAGTRLLVLEMKMEIDRVDDILESML